VCALDSVGPKHLRHAVSAHRQKVLGPTGSCGARRLPSLEAPNHIPTTKNPAKIRVKSPVRPSSEQGDSGHRHPGPVQPVPRPHHAAPSHLPSPKRQEQKETASSLPALKKRAKKTTKNPSAGKDPSPPRTRAHLIHPSLPPSQRPCP
jgi:hypothetical protein